MSIGLSQKLIAAGAILVAAWLGWLIAEGEQVLPAFFAGLALLGCLTRLTHVSVATLAVGVVLFGYLVGNRGFAQLTPVPGIPILPAELALGICGAWLALQCAFSRQLPFRRDALNGIVLLWLIVGTARVIFDVRQFGFMAIRDYAMVYYAAFFFVVQHLMAERGARRFLIGVLIVASVAQPIATLLSTTFPEFFYTVLTFRGTPLIHFKGDLALTFMAVSAFVLAFAVEGRFRWLALIVATLVLLYVISGDNRASVLGTIAAFGWLLFSRARRFVGGQALAVAGTFLIMAALALFFEAGWAQKKFHGVAERVHSLTDFFGSGTYVSEESSMKGDNNRFRAVWWKTVVEETLDRNPWFGLGFGHDLAAAFLREFNPEMADDFTARSPHSIIVSAIGRMGAVGLAGFLLLCGALTVRTWRAVRDQSTSRADLGLWAGVWTILISACFGVVLEGPMGAVVFWSLLGILSGAEATDKAPAETLKTREEEEKSVEDRAEPLPTRLAADEVGSSRTT
jgi:hypothetical protein